MGIPRQEYRSGLPFPSPGDFTNPRMEPRSPKLQADSLSSELQGSLLERKRVRVDRHPDRLRDSCPCVRLNRLHGASRLGFLWPAVLLCLVLSLHLVYFKDLACVFVYLLAKTDSSEEAYR